MKNGQYTLVIAPVDYPGRKYRERYCYEHHLVWWQSTGEVISEEEIIHHINGKHRDNRIENLKKRLRVDHAREHTLARGRTMVRLHCPTCGNIFVRRKGQSHLQKPSNGISFCSRVCIGKFNFGAASDEKINMARATNVIEIFKQSGIV